MHAFIFLGGTVSDREAAIITVLDTEHIAPYNRLTLVPDEKPTVGIADVRAFIHRLSFAPPDGNGDIAAVIADIAALTPQAQQALLKTIEEPPKHVRLYLGAAAEAVTLPTIVSRCAVTRLPASEHDGVTDAVMEQLTAILAAPCGKRISLIQSAAAKEDCVLWIDQAVTALRRRMLTDPDPLPTQNGKGIPVPALIHNLLAAREFTSRNINPHLLLEHVFLPL